LSHDDTSSDVWKVDPQTNQVVDTISLSYPNTWLAASPGAIWLASAGTQQVTKINPQTDKVMTTISVPDAGWLAYGAGSLWVCGVLHGSVLRIDPATDQTLKRFDIGSQEAHHCAALAIQDNTIWAEALIGDDADVSGAMVYQIDATANTLGATPSTMPEPLKPGIEVDGQQAWVYSSANLYRLNAQTDQVTGTLSLKYGTGIAVGDGSVWLTTGDPNTDTGTLLRLTPAS
jgi:hypothetical protein